MLVERRRGLQRTKLLQKYCTSTRRATEYSYNLSCFFVSTETDCLVVLRVECAVYCCGIKCATIVGGKFMSMSLTDLVAFYLPQSFVFVCIDRDMFGFGCECVCMFIAEATHTHGARLVQKLYSQRLSSYRYGALSL